MALLTANRNYDIYLSSTQPNQIRFRILNADSSFKVRLSMHYFTSNRIDLYKNEMYVDPTNANYTNGKMFLMDIQLNNSAVFDKYMPTYTNASGSNLFIRQKSKMYFSLWGNDYIDLKIAPFLYVKFGVPAITPEAFFDSATLVQNFADLLGITPDKIRYVNIVRDTSIRRKRLSSDIIFIELEIFENPITNLSQTAQFASLSNFVETLEANITNLFTTGELQNLAQAKLNIELSSFFVQKPFSGETPVEIKKLDRLIVLVEASNCREQSPCDIQPVLLAVNENVREIL
jgi:hypothetical protein